MAKHDETLWLIRVDTRDHDATGLAVVVASATAIGAIEKAQRELGYEYPLPMHSIEMIAFSGYLITDKTGEISLPKLHRQAQHASEKLAKEQNGNG